MKIIKTAWENFGVGSIRLGRQGENLVRRLKVDISAPLEAHPDADFAIRVESPAGVVYNAAQTVQEDEWLMWDITDADTAVSGEGSVQIVMIGDGEEIAKTAKAKTVILSSLGSGGEAPDPVKGWLDEAQKLLEDLKDQGSVNEEEVQQIVADWMAAHPITEADPTVPSWAKQPEKPTYTAQEVGAVSTEELETAKKEIVQDVLDQIPQGGGGTAVQADWSQNDPSQPDYVQNRTHWLERPYEPIEWDMITAGRDTFDASLVFGAPAGSVVFTKISDMVLSKEQLAASKVYAEGYKGDTVATFGEVLDFAQDAIWTADFQDLLSDEDEYFSSIRGTVACTAVSGDFTETFGVVIPSTGTYIWFDPGLGIYRFDSLNADVWHKLDKEFIPEIDVKEIESKLDFHRLGRVPAIRTGNDNSSVLLNYIGTNIADGIASLAEGNNTKAFGEASHAEGEHTIARCEAQHVQGRYNIEDTSGGAYGKYAHIVGNGDNLGRSNAYTLDWDGNGWFAGSVSAKSLKLYSGDTEVELTPEQLGSIGGGGLPTGGEPYQQLVTDGEGNAKWEDRLCYEEGIQAVVLPATELSNTDGQFIYTGELTNQPIAGANHVVKLTANSNTLVYNCIGIEISEDGMTGVFLGNAAALGGDDTGEPFGAVILSPESAAQMGFSVAFMSVGDLLGTDPITFSVEINSVEVKKKIPSRFLDAVPEIDLISWGFDEFSTDGQTKSFEEIGISLEDEVALKAKLDKLQVIFVHKSDVFPDPIRSFATGMKNLLLGKEQYTFSIMEGDISYRMFTFRTVYISFAERQVMIITNGSPSFS